MKKLYSILILLFVLFTSNMYGATSTAVTIDSTGKVINKTPLVFPSNATFQATLTYNRMTGSDTNNPGSIGFLATNSVGAVILTIDKDSAVSNYLTLNLSSVALGQTLTFRNISGNTAVLTNIDLFMENGVSNSVYASTNLLSTWPATNATTGAYTNTVDFNRKMVRIGITNSILYMTNFTGNLAGTIHEAAVWMHIGGGSVNKTVTWPSGNAYGLRWVTSANNTLWTTLTNDKTYIVSYSQVDTNVFTTIILVE